MGLNYAQSDRDAALRAELVNVRENAELVALTQQEGRWRARAMGRLHEPGRQHEADHCGEP